MMCLCCVQVIETWMDMIHRDATISNPKLTRDHLLVLMKALRDFIQDQNQDTIKNALGKTYTLIGCNV